MINRIRKSFARAVECKHGGKVQEAASILGREPLDFSANINPLGYPPLEELIAEEIKNIAHYPDNSYRGLCRAAAKFADVDEDCIVPGNGSSELIRLMAEACLEEGKLALVPTPSFGEYTNQSLLAGGKVEKTKIGEDGLPVLDQALLEKAQTSYSSATPTIPPEGFSRQIRSQIWRTDARGRRPFFWWTRPSLNSAGRRRAWPPWRRRGSTYS